jgi:hypothetical protein
LRCEMEKRCTKCGQTKDVNEFHKDKKGKDGFAFYCKKCVGNKSKRWYEKNRDKVLIRGYEHYHFEGGKEVKDIWQINNKDKAKTYKDIYRQTIKGKDASTRGFKIFKEKYPEKTKAHQIIHHAIEAGKFPRVNTLTCHRCHVNQAEHYHHPDYSKPMDVIPLCVQCHIDIHNQS